MLDLVPVRLEAEPRALGQAHRAVGRERVAGFQAQEKEYSGNPQCQGTMKGIWRVVGEYSNYCIYDVRDNDELHAVLSGFPMYPYMKIKVTPLADHPNVTDAVAY